MDIYAVLGNPIKHSLSPIIHHQFSQQTGIALHFDKILVPLNGFVKAVQNFIKRGACGFNITAPFKLDAFVIATQLTDNAKIAGAVNTIKVKGKQLIGENTDGSGLVNDLSHNIGISLKDKNILILGAGGAARGILLPLLNCQPKQVMIANRSREKAISLAKDFAVYGQTCGFGLNEIKPEAVDIIINATSAALTGQMPQIPTDVANGSLCYDLAYAQQTPFMDWALDNNALMVVDGLGMLVEQAAISYEFWTGIKPKTQAVLASLREQGG